MATGEERAKATPSRVVTTVHGGVVLVAGVAAAATLGTLRAVADLYPPNVTLYRVTAILGLAVIAVATWRVLPFPSSWRQLLVLGALLGAFLGGTFALAELLALRVLWDDTESALEWGTWPAGERGAAMNFVASLFVGAGVGATTAFLAAIALFAVQEFARVRLLVAAVALAATLGIVRALADLYPLNLTLYRVAGILLLALVPVATWLLLRFPSSWRQLLFLAVLFGAFLGGTFAVGELLALRVVWDDTESAVEWGRWPPGDSEPALDFVRHLFTFGAIGAVIGLLAAAVSFPVRRLARSLRH